MLADIRMAGMVGETVEVGMVEVMAEAAEAAVETAAVEVEAAKE